MYLQWLQTKEKQKIPIILAGIMTKNNKYYVAPKKDENNNNVSHKLVTNDQAYDVLKEFSGIRYFEISTPESAKELFAEVARIKIRSIEFQPKDISPKISKYAEKKAIEIDFRKKGISLLPNNIYALSQFAQKIRLDLNTFKYFPTELYAFTQLQELNLAMNQIKEIPNDLYQLPNLSKLDLENNLIDTIPIPTVITQLISFF